MQFVRSKSNLSTTADTDRMPSRHIWQDCPIEQIKSGVVNGVYFFDDFTGGGVIATNTSETGFGDHYKAYTSDGATIVDGAEAGGTKVLSSDGDNEGCAIATVNLPFRIDTDRKKLWFECRIKSSTITDTKHGFFVGLGESMTLSATVPIAAAGTLADQNFVGFHRLEGDGDAVDFVYKANGVTQVTVQADGATLAADTYIKLGFVFEHRADLYTGTKYVLTPFYNGLRMATTKTIPAADGTDFPNDVQMGLLLAVLNATGSTPGSTEIDWWAAAQIYDEIP